MEMSAQELQDFYDKVADLTVRATEGEVRAYINAQYPRLPENVQNEIAFRLVATALEDEAESNKE